MTVFFPGADVCAICDRPCVHEIAEKQMPMPGAYVAETVNHPEQLAVPVCDACVERHYPAFVPTVEAARLHYWTH